MLISDTLDEWLRRESIPFSMDLPQSLNAAIDAMLGSLGASVEVLGFGEALHGGQDILTLRNRLFQRLAEAHGYSAIAVESSFPRGQIVNDYVAGRGAASYDAVQETGFSHGFGRIDANRELVEWMRAYNADPRHRIKLNFYGFDSPTEMAGADSPRQLLHFVLDYLESFDGVSGRERRRRIDELLGPDADWNNPAAGFDPTKSIGRSPAATALRVETEDLISDLNVRLPELAAKGEQCRYSEAAQYASMARQLLNYHAALARNSDGRIAQLLGIRDVMMADNLAYAAARERGRGKVLAFAHNSHLQRGQAQWQLGAELIIWWPAGSHLHEALGRRYSVIGSAVGASEVCGIAQPETGTLEARLTSLPEGARFIPTHQGQGIAIADMAVLPKRTGSAKNASYFPLSAQSLTDFDWLAVLNWLA